MQGKIPFINGTITGHYRAAVVTGLTTGVGAGGCVFSARWNSALGIRALLLGLRIQASVVTPFTAANEVNFAAQIARAWTASDTGGAVVTFTSPSQEMNSLADVPTICEARVANAASLGNGTRTLDDNAFLYLLGNQPSTAPQSGLIAMGEWYPRDEFNSPQNFNSLAGSQEGFVINNKIAQGAGGTVRVSIEWEWVEYQSGTNVGSLA